MITLAQHLHALEMMQNSPYVPNLFRSRCAEFIETQAIRFIWERIEELINSGRILILAGAPGCGKSFAAEYCRFLAGITTSYAMIQDRVMTASEIIELSFKFRDDFHILADDSRLVIIDDLGAEYDSERGWQFSNWQEFFDRRYRNKLPTIVTTNLTRDEFRTRYGDRTTDRINEWGWRYGINEPSMRGKQ